MGSCCSYQQKANTADETEVLLNKSPSASGPRGHEESRQDVVRGQVDPLENEQMKEDISGSNGTHEKCRKAGGDRLVYTETKGPKQLKQVVSATVETQDGKLKEELSSDTPSRHAEEPSSKAGERHLEDPSFRIEDRPLEELSSHPHDPSHSTGATHVVERPSDAANSCREVPSLEIETERRIESPFREVDNGCRGPLKAESLQDNSFSNPEPQEESPFNSIPEQVSTVCTHDALLENQAGTTEGGELKNADVNSIMSTSKRPVEKDPPGERGSSAGAAKQVNAAQESTDGLVHSSTSKPKMPKLEHRTEESDRAAGGSPKDPEGGHPGQRAPKNVELKVEQGEDAGRAEEKDTPEVAVGKKTASPTLSPPEAPVEPTNRSTPPSVEVTEGPMKADGDAAETEENNDEDLYRGAEEIEEERGRKCKTQPQVLVVPEDRSSVAAAVDLLSYSQREWKGNTAKSALIRKGYVAVSQSFQSLRRVRGDNYCALRAALFQVLSQSHPLPAWLQEDDITQWPEKLLASEELVGQWKFPLEKKKGEAIGGAIEQLKQYLELLKERWQAAVQAGSAEERQRVCERAFQGGEEEYGLLEALKFLMLRTASSLHARMLRDDDDVPVFCWLLFARDSSSCPRDFLSNHLSHVGFTGGLEQVEMFLLGYTLQRTIQVHRLYKTDTEEFITFYPDDHKEDWPAVSLVTEDDRHYNILVGKREEPQQPDSSTLD